MNEHVTRMDAERLVKFSRDNILVGIRIFEKTKERINP